MQSIRNKSIYSGTKTRISLKNVLIQIQKTYFYMRIAQFCIDLSNMKCYKNEKMSVFAIPSRQ